MPLPRGRVTYCTASFRNCLHFRIAVQPRWKQHASAQSLRCQRKQKFSSQAIIWEHTKDLVSQAKNLYNSWLVKQRKCSQKGFGFLLQANTVAENLLFLACTEIEEQGQSSALLDTVVRRNSSSSNTGKLSECSTLQHRGSNHQHPTFPQGHNDTVTTLHPPALPDAHHTYWRTSLCSRLYFPPFFMAALCTASMARSMDWRTTSCSSTCKTTSNLLLCPSAEVLWHQRLWQERPQYSKLQEFMFGKESRCYQHQSPMIPTGRPETKLQDLAAASNI